MRQRLLPAVEQYRQLKASDNPADADAYLRQVMGDVVRQPGFQFVLQTIYNVEGVALRELREGSRDVAHCAGRIQASESIRTALLALLPDDVTLAENEPEEEFEDANVYASPFDIAPSGV